MHVKAQKCAWKVKKIAENFEKFWGKKSLEPHSDPDHNPKTNHSSCMDSMSR